MIFLSRHPFATLATLAASLLLTLGLAVPALAVGPPVTSVAASYRNSTVTFSGQARSDVAAVAVLLYNPPGTLLRMGTAEVADDGSFSGTFPATLTTAGTYTVRASDYEGGSFASATFTVAASGGGGSGSNSGSSGESDAADEDWYLEETEATDSPEPAEETSTAEPGPATATPGREASPAAPSKEGVADGSGSLLPWIWLGGAVLVAGAGGGIAFFRASRGKLTDG